jgi:hypothetical protein
MGGSMSAKVIQFPSYPAEQARRLASGSSWGSRPLLGLVAGTGLLATAAFASGTLQPLALGLLLAGLGLILSAVIALGVWLRRASRDTPGWPWGRLLLAALLAACMVSLIARDQHWLAWASAFNTLQWVLAITLLVRLVWLARLRTPADQAAMWAAGVSGESIVAQELARLSSDHVVIHSLPLAGCGDADHVVVGPAGVVTIETKSLAGRVVCGGDGRWVQARRDLVREIRDPAGQARRAAAAVSRRLEHQGARGLPVWPLLVMAHPSVELDVAMSPVRVVRPGELVPLLELLAARERRLDRGSVSAVASRLAESPVPGARARSRAPAQALVEVACALGVMLLLAFGLLGVARVTGSLLGLTAVAREAARAGARAPDAATAVSWASDRGQQVAVEYGLYGVSLDVDTSSFDVQPSPDALVPGEVRVSASVSVDLSDVPLVSWAQVHVPLRRAYAEVVDPYRSAPSGAEGDDS